jgi:hypothetical protein
MDSDEMPLDSADHAQQHLAEAPETASQPTPVEQLQRLAQMFHARGKVDQAQEIYRLILELKRKSHP